MKNANSEATVSRWALVLPLMLGWLWCACNDYVGLNGQDTHDHLLLSKGWSKWASGGPMPQMVEHPHGYPIIGALLAPLLGELLALRIISVGSLLLMIYMLASHFEREGMRRDLVVPYLLLTLGLSPFLLRLSLTAMADVPTMVCMVGAFIFAMRWISSARQRYALIALCLLVAGVFIRMATIPMALILFLAMINGPVVGRRTRWSVALMLILLVGVVLLFIVDVKGLTTGQALAPMADWSLGNILGRTLHSDDGVLHYQVPNLLYVLKVFVHPGSLLIGAPMLFFVRHNDLSRPAGRVALLLIITYLLFLTVMPFQNDRILLAALPFVVVVLRPAFERMLCWVRAKEFRPIWVFFVMALLQVGLCMRAMHPFFQQARVERELATAVNRTLADQVYTHGMGAAFKNYCPSVNVTELWYGPIHRFKPGALVVVHPQNLREQWTGHHPEQNWNQMLQQGVDPIEQRKDGWLIGKIPDN